MAAKPKNKMPIADRAKQFMPFAALKGLPEALLQKEHDVTSQYKPQRLIDAYDPQCLMDEASLQYEPEYLKYDEGCEPGDDALTDYDCDSPFSAEFPLD